MKKGLKINLQLFAEKKTNKYYSMEVVQREAIVYIFGDIVVPEWEWFESDTSGYSLANDIKDLDVDVIHVHINSYGGHVSEGLAIHNILRQHAAKIKTYCDGFACSAASVVFMAGDERIMLPASLLMIHHAWNMAIGNAEDLRKAANDLETISKTAANTYKAAVKISEEDLEKLLSEETWISPEDAVEMGFATSIAKETVTSKAAASARKALLSLVTQKAPKQSELNLCGETIEAITKFSNSVSELKSMLESSKEFKPQQNKPKNLMAALFR